MSRYFRIFWRNLSLITRLKFENVKVEFPLLIKLSLHHEQDDCQQKQAICNKLERRLTDFFQDYPNSIRFNLVHLCPAMLLFPFAVFLSRCSTVLSGFCNVSFHVLVILGFVKLHYFA